MASNYSYEQMEPDHVVWVGAEPDVGIMSNTETTQYTLQIKGDIEEFDEDLIRDEIKEEISDYEELDIHLFGFSDDGGGLFCIKAEVVIVRIQ